MPYVNMNILLIIMQHERSYGLHIYAVVERNVNKIYKGLMRSDQLDQKYYGLYIATKQLQLYTL